MLGAMVVGFCQLISSGFAAAKVSETEVDCCTSKVDLHGPKQYFFNLPTRNAVQNNMVLIPFQLSSRFSGCNPFKVCNENVLPVKTVSRWTFLFIIKRHQRCMQHRRSLVLVLWALIGLPYVAIIYHNEIPVQCPPNVLKFHR